MPKLTHCSFLLLSFVPLLGSTQDPATKEAVKTPLVVKATDAKWGDHPFIAGGKLCVQDGDPSKGPSVLLMKFPKGLTIAPHWHTSDEIVTVVSGSAVFGSGETPDEARGTLVGSGGYLVLPCKQPHWALVKEDLTFTVTLNRPADFHPAQ